MSYHTPFGDSEIQVPLSSSLLPPTKKQNTDQAIRLRSHS